MNLQTIIDEADVRIPNAFSSDQKVDWLNEVNYEFFDIIKIPKTASITLDGITNQFSVPVDLREKNVRKVVVGSNYYRSMIYDDITAAFNYYTIDEATNKIVFTPKPPAGNAVIVYDMLSTTPFVSTTLTASPVAPTEYHWLYVLGLCVRIAKAMNDVTLANNYESDYKNNLSVAQQNFLRG
jgi:hypothetical protein